MCTILFTEGGRADIKALPKSVRNSLKSELKEKLAKDPEGCSFELRDSLAGYRSFHFRDYRLVFKIVEDDGRKVVVVIGVGERGAHSRENIYRRLELAVQQGKLAEHILLTLKGFSRR